MKVLLLWFTGQSLEPAGTRGSSPSPSQELTKVERPFAILKILPIPVINAIFETVWIDIHIFEQEIRDWADEIDDRPLPWVDQFRDLPNQNFCY